MLHFSGKLIAGQRIQLNCLPDHFLVQQDAPVVNLLRQVVFFPDTLRHRETDQGFLDGHLHFYIAFVVSLEQTPFAGLMFGAIPRPASVHLGGLAGHGEVFDQSLALRHFLILQFQHRAHTLQ